jgi:hypothetical protein
MCINSWEESKNSDMSCASIHGKGARIQICHVHQFTAREQEFRYVMCINSRKGNQNSDIGHVHQFTGREPEFRYRSCASIHGKGARIQTQFPFINPEA